MRGSRIAFCACLLWSCCAMAQGREQEDPRLLFESGLKNMLAGEYNIGCAFIRRSRDLDPKPGTIFTLAECYARAGKTASAVEMYDEYLALYETLPPEDRERQRERADLSKTERANLLKNVPWLTVVLPDSAPGGVAVTMDEKPFPQNLLGVAIAVDPGAHRFTTRAPSSRITEMEVDMDPGERRNLVLNVVVESDSPDDSSSPYSDDSPIAADEARSQAGTSPWVYVMGGIGIAGLATGAVTGGLLLDKRSTILDDCERTDDKWDCETPQGYDALDSAQNVLAPATTIALGVGVGGLAVAAILLLTDGTEPAQSVEARHVRPIVGLGGKTPSVGIHGNF